MKLTDIQTVLKSKFSSVPSTSVLLVGPPGIGKTAIIRQIAQEAGLDLLVLALPTCESVDLRGLPYRDEQNRSRWASPLPKQGKGVLLLDELSSAELDVQVAAHHLLWREDGSDMTLGPDWHLVATGNRAQDRAKVKPLSAPLRSRLTVLTAEPDLESFLVWGKANNISNHVISFLHWRPNLAYTDTIPQEQQFPTYRGWEIVSGILTEGYSAAVETEMIASTIGDGASLEFATHLKQARELPPCEVLMDDPDKAPLPKSPSAHYAVAIALGAWSNKTGLSAMPYMRRLPAEYAMLWIKEVKEKLDLREDVETKAWLKEHKHVL